MNLREKKMLTGNTSPFSKMNVSVTRKSDNKFCNNYGPHIPEAEEKKYLIIEIIMAFFARLCLSFA